VGSKSTISAHFCPFGSLDKGPKPLPLAVAAPHQVRVDPQRELGIGVAELGHDARKILAASGEDRGECVAELVRGEPLGQGRQAALGEELVGALGNRLHYPLANVVLVTPPASRSCEESFLGTERAETGFVDHELVA
jgi:hypothetical protein